MGAQRGSPVERNYLSRVLGAINSIPLEQVDAFVTLLVEARVSSHCIFVVGNGGSAATASHMATDLGVGSHRLGAGLRVVSLTDNLGALTATANDVSFDQVYSSQIELLGASGDVLIAISASGNSPNLISAVKSARNRGMKVVTLTGFSGGELALLADISIHVSTAIGDYGPAEDTHLVINHLVTEMFRARCLPPNSTSLLHG